MLSELVEARVGALPQGQISSRSVAGAREGELPRGRAGCDSRGKAQLNSAMRHVTRPRDAHALPAPS